MISSRQGGHYVIHLERTGERVLMSMVVLCLLFALYALWMSD